MQTLTFSNRTTPLCPAILARRVRYPGDVGDIEPAVLDSLVEATVPTDIRVQGPLTIPSPRGEQGGAGRIARDGRAESGLALPDRHGLLRLHYAAGDPA